MNNYSEVQYVALCYIFCSGSFTTISYQKNTGNGEFAILQPLDDGLRQGNIHPEADAVQSSGSFLPSPKHLYQG